MALTRSLRADESNNSIWPIRPSLDQRECGNVGWTAQKIFARETDGVIECKCELSRGERVAHTISPGSYRCRTNFEGSDVAQSVRRHRSWPREAQQPKVRRIRTDNQRRATQKSAKQDATRHYHPQVLATGYFLRQTDQTRKPREPSGSMRNLARIALPLRQATTLNPSSSQRRE